MHNKISAFTLVELLVTIAVGAIVLAIGVPSFNNLIQTNQLATQTNKFIGVLNYARSEAVKRKQDIIICPSSAEDSCNGGNSFDNGWLVYVDADTNNTFSAGDTSLWLSNALSNRVTLNATFSRVEFNSNGRPTTPGNVVVCIDDDFNIARRIVVPLSGNVRVSDNSVDPITSCAPS